MFSVSPGAEYEGFGDYVVNDIRMTNKLIRWRSRDCRARVFEHRTLVWRRFSSRGKDAYPANNEEESVIKPFTNGMIAKWKKKKVLGTDVEGIGM